MKTQVLSQARSVFRQLYFAEQLTQCHGRGVGLSGSFCRCNDFMLISIIITSLPAERQPANTRHKETLPCLFLHKHTEIWQNVRMTVFGVDDSLLKVMTWVRQI